MNTKNAKFKIALDWLCENRGIDGQKGLSEATGITETTISRILNDKVKKPSEETLRRLNEAFDGVFNMDFFRCKSPNMLAKEVHQPISIDMGASNTSILSDLHSLRNEMKDELTLLRQARHELQEATEQLRTLILSQRSQYYPNIAAEDTTTEYNRTTPTPNKNPSNFQ